MKLSLSIDRSELNSTIEEQKYAFIVEILSSINLPLDSCLPESGNSFDFTLEYKVKLRQLLGKHNINIIDNNNDEIKIYSNNELIAKWNKPSFEFKENLKDNKIYTILNIDYWSIYEKV